MIITNYILLFNSLIKSMYNFLIAAEPFALQW